MKLGIDISQIVYKGTGVARFTKGLVEAILENDRHNEWVFLFSSLRRRIDPKLAKKIKDKGHRLIVQKVPPSALSILWNSIHRLRVEKITGRLDWFITSDWTEPPANAKKATVVHDLAFIRYPETVDKTIRETQRKRLRWVKKESDLIFADSKSTKDDLMEFYKIPNKKIQVIYPGVSIQNPTQSNIKEVLKKYKTQKPFILTVGKIEPRKNLKRLIEAFEKIKRLDIDLVVVGQRGWEEIESKLPNIKFLGYVSDEDLACLYRSCLFFIYPSIWEGFGYPVVEAMSQGAAVATSNTSSLREIGIGASYLFNPLETKDIQKALDVLLNEDDLRRELAKKGFKRAKEFTWKNYYNKFIKAL